jgi:hypothetical protein
MAADPKKEIGDFKKKTKAGDHCFGCINCLKSEDDLEKGQKLQTCSKCNIALYCSVACQREDWPSHKTRCISLAHQSTFVGNQRIAVVHTCDDAKCKATGGVIFEAMPEPEVSDCIARAAINHMRTIGDPADGFVVLKRDFDTKLTTIFFEPLATSIVAQLARQSIQGFTALEKIYEDNKTSAPAARKHLLLPVCSKNPNHRFVTCRGYT